MGDGLAFGYLAALFAFYILPLIIAAVRDHHNMVAIAALNMLLGWTFVGWVVALVWSLTETRKAKVAARGPVRGGMSERRRKYRATFGD
jgi:hypothetical protein